MFMKNKKAMMITMAALMAVALPSPLLAQTKVRFDGVAIRGGMMSVVNRLRLRGWKVDEVADHAVTLTGKWEKMAGVTATVIEAEDGGGVTDVGVLVPCELDWADVHAKWQDVVGRISDSWGEPEVYDETFDTPGSMTSGEALVALQEGHCRYRARWSAEGGTVEAVPAFIPYTYCILVRYSVEKP